MRTYLDRVGPTYYFRRVVPEHLRPYFLTETGKPRTEFKISLRTKDRRQADRLVELKAVEISAMIAAAQSKYDAGIPPTGKSRVDDTLERYEEIQLEAEAEASRSQFEAEQEETALIDSLTAPVRELSAEQRAMRRLLPSELFDPPEVQAARAARRKRAEDEAAKIVAAEFKAGTLGKPKYQLDKILDRYTEVVKPTAATLKKWRTAIAHLKAFLKHDAADRITQQDIIRWRDALLREGRSVETVRNNYLGAVKAVLQVAVEEGVISTNPIKDVRVRQEKRPQLRGKDFTPAEAATILRATLGDHSGIAPDHALARRWVPWVCAYTGARVNEITQLRQCDILQDGDTWAIRITPEAGTVKNGKARTVPLHAHLIEQGFHKLREGGTERPLFFNPDKSRGDRGGSGAHAHNMKRGERLAAWVRGLGVTDKAIRPNHAWRHMFRTRGYSAGVPDSALEAIMGHAPVNVAGSYGNWQLNDLKREIDKLPRFEV